MDISNISVLLPKSSRRELGSRAADGAVYVVTVKAAKIRNWNFFSSKSSDFKRNIYDPFSDTLLTYVLNGKALSDSAIGALYLIDKNNLKQLRFFSIKDHEIPPNRTRYKKQFVMYIEAKRPKGLATNRNWN
jgi:hypothetical protein